MRLPRLPAPGTRDGNQVLASGLRRTALFAFLWWTLTAADSHSWIIGVPVVLAATAASLALSPPSRWRISLAGLAGFIPYFTWRSMAGSVDVAWRVLHPRLPISPSFEEYPLRLPAEGPARVFFADIVSLLPGTLSAELRADSMTIHVLNGDSPNASTELQRLELKVGALFGLQLAASRGSSERPHD